ncbi:hypothetical protein M8Z33_18140 [Streptomyces sp. ZAF1911]|uniref:hypothetical protein n=1 Tax=Streptomyces sp. ZAF1911 TaxID=2944129 RepID=UPI00237A9F51|nr:hypothetical protein [Streptomyces sp. ZAF1911]MDD9378542.1 hypothetical protein [Streptomyces sp. ZAF1911]
MQNLKLLKAIVERKNRLRRGADEGQTVFEYLGIIVIIALIIAAIIASGLAGNIAGAITTVLGDITGD